LLNTYVTLKVEATLTNLIHFVDGGAMYRHKLLNVRVTVFGFNVVGRGDRTEGAVAILSSLKPCYDVTM
jgi:hypothetical protein